jgi:NADH-quinone oxidoreductase subunit N
MNADISQAFQLIVIISMADDGRNIMALRQVNVKRILAFSGISRTGFMLMTYLIRLTLNIIVLHLLMH